MNDLFSSQPLLVKLVVYLQLCKTFAAASCFQLWSRVKRNINGVLCRTCVTMDFAGVVMAVYLCK